MGGDIADAIETFEIGSAFKVADVELEAQLAVARQRRHSHYTPDPEAREHLRMLDTAIDQSDTPLRVALLGRLGALAMQPPVDVALATEATTRAMAIARRLDQAESLAQALHDRFLWITTIERLSERDEHADEMIAVSRRAGRPDLALFGLQWRLHAELNRHDMTAAQRTVDEAGVLAGLSRVSEWRIRVLVQRALLLGLAGDRRAAFAPVDRIDTEAASAIPPLRPHDRSAHTMFVRNALCTLYGTVNPDLGQMRDREEWIDGVDNSAAQVLFANLELRAGRREAVSTTPKMRTGCETPKGGSETNSSSSGCWTTVASTTVKVKSSWRPR